ncbi:MAG: hypothetical protein R3B69_01735 [Candidatus Paceibacterota bacterium]
MDSNDVQFNDYSLDFFGFLKLFFSGGSIDGSGSGQYGSGFDSAGSSAADSFARLIDFFASAWSVFVVFSWIISALLIFGLIYAYLRTHHYEELQDEGLLLNERLYQELYGSRSGNTRWDDVLMHIADDPKNLASGYFRG